MEKKVIVVCCIAGFLGLLCAALGIAAEFKKPKRDELEQLSPFKCKYPKTPVLGLGLGASVCVLVAQVLVSATSGYSPGTIIPYQAHARILGNIYRFNWFTTFWSLIVFPFFSYYSHGDQTIDNFCYLAWPGLFAITSLLALTGVFLGIIHCLVCNTWVSKSKV